MLKSGEVDYAGFPPSDYKEAKTFTNVTVYEWWPAAASWSYLGFNLRNAQLQDLKVRQALSYAIDRNPIIESVMYGLSGPTYGPFVPASWVYRPDLPKYEYNQQRAKELLAEAGYVPGRDGILEKDGKALNLKLLFGPNTSKVREQISAITQQQFREIGVGLSIQGLEWASYLSALQTEPFDWDLSVSGWASTIDPHWMYQIWSEETIPDLNHVAYVNKRVEQLFAQGAREFETEKRKTVYQEIQTLIVNDAPYIFLTADKSYVGINNRIGGIEPTSLGIGYNIEQWYVK
jgi:peptide/nickel transport system substrate-binding protein